MGLTLDWPDERRGLPRAFLAASPLLCPRDRQSKGHTYTAILNMTKAMFGAAVLGVPHAMAIAGKRLGILLFVLAITVSTYTMCLVARTKILLEKCKPRPVTTYAVLVSAIFGQIGGSMVEVCIIVLELCFCTGFVIVMTSSLVDFGWFGSDRLLIISGMFPVLLVLANVRFLKDLWQLSLFGLVVYSFGLVVIVVQDGATSEEERPPAVEHPWSHVPMAFGSLLYAMESLPTVLPNINAMQRPLKGVAVICLSMGLYMLVALPYSILAVDVFNMGSCRVLVDCLSPGIPAKVFLLAVVLGIALSYPLVLFVATEMLEERLEADTFIKRLMVRCPQVMVTCVVGWAVPNFSQFSGVIGDVLLSLLGLILPVVAYHRACGMARHRLSVLTWIANTVCVSIGFLCLALAFCQYL
uniref:Amino acid transporter transmembrane domain-containing protein n=1 Tax=Alexandrium catenella TaxID=2925 RepID=A0A7S1RWG5_ALECA|mmetsp:Transcript_75395/g.200240  ORF Transcript_75395/g.200240 Transcript_75395/m.200240 type:complete len:412 (-) Transcript_75395:79-1314(-)